MPIDVFWETGEPPEGATAQEPGFRRRKSRDTVAAADPKGRFATGRWHSASTRSASATRRSARSRAPGLLTSSPPASMATWAGSPIAPPSAPPARAVARGAERHRPRHDYAPEDDPLAVLDRPDRGGISVYARNRDYHDVVKGSSRPWPSSWLSRFGPGVKVFVEPRR